LLFHSNNDCTNAPPYYVIRTLPALFLSETVMKNCTLCKMEHQHILLFTFVPCFTNMLLVGGLGVEDRENCFCQVPILLHVIYFLRVWAQREACLSKPRAL